MKNSSTGNNLLFSTFIITSLFVAFLMLIIILTNQSPEDKIEMPFLFWIMISWPCFVIFLVLEILGIKRIVKWNIIKKYKIILLFTWILLNVAYLIIFYILYSFNKINQWSFDKDIALKRTANHSIVLFSFLLFLLVIRILLSLLIFKSDTIQIIIDEVFLVLYIVTFTVLLSSWLYSIFYGISLLKLINIKNEKLLLAISIISIIPFANSINWILNIIYKQKHKLINNQYICEIY